MSFKVSPAASRSRKLVVLIVAPHAERLECFIERINRSDHWLHFEVTLIFEPIFS